MYDFVDYESLDDFVELVGDEMDSFAHDARCLPIQPQPMTDCPVLMCTEVVEEMILIPVCIQTHFPGLDVTYWADFVEPEVSLDYIKGLLRNDWVEGSRIFIGESITALQDHTIERPRSGHLIRVVRPGRRVSPIVSCGAKLADRALFLRNVDVEGFPEDDEDY